MFVLKVHLIAKPVSMEKTRSAWQPIKVFKAKDIKGEQARVNNQCSKNNPKTPKGYNVETKN